MLSVGSANPSKVKVNGLLGQHTYTHKQEQLEPGVLSVLLLGGGGCAVDVVFAACVVFALVAKLVPQRIVPLTA